MNIKTTKNKHLTLEDQEEIQSCLSCGVSFKAISAQIGKNPTTVSVEKNHTLFRDIVPKGESFDSFTQDTVNLISSHVNSVKRKSLNVNSS